MRHTESHHRNRIREPTHARTNAPTPWPAHTTSSPSTRGGEGATRSVHAPSGWWIAVNSGNARPDALSRLRFRSPRLPASPSTTWLAVCIQYNVLGTLSSTRVVDSPDSSLRLPPLATPPSPEVALSRGQSRDLVLPYRLLVSTYAIADSARFIPWRALRRGFPACITVPASLPMQAWRFCASCRRAAFDPRTKPPTEPWTVVQPTGATGSDAPVSKHLLGSGLRPRQAPRRLPPCLLGRAGGRTCLP